MPLLATDLATPPFHISTPSVQPASLNQVHSDGLTAEHLEQFAGPVFLELEQIHSAVASEVSNLSAPLTFPTSIESITLGGRVIAFKRPLEGSLSWGQHEIELEIPELDIIISGASLSGVQAELIEEFEVLAKNFLNASDGSLAPSGLDLKHKLQAILGP
jgi:hypothetical protein